MLKFLADNLISEIAEGLDGQTSWDGIAVEISNLTSTRRNLEMVCKSRHDYRHILRQTGDEV